MSIHCACIATEHHVYSTNEDDNRTKEYTFTNSHLFGLGVPYKQYALSAAILIHEDHRLDSMNSIKINIVNDNESSISKTYDFETIDLEEYTSDYFKILNITNEFIQRIYNKEYDKCLASTAFDVDLNEFTSVFEPIVADFNKGYIETNIVSYKPESGKISIFGAIMCENMKLDLFTMDFNDEFKIISVNF